MSSTEPVAPGNRTLASAFAQLTVRDGVAILGLVGVVIGSIGPWVTSPLTSVSGMRSDGPLTLGLAVLALVLLVAARRGRLATFWLSVAIVIIAIARMVHIHRKLHSVTILGVPASHYDHVGWGLWLTIVAAVVAAAAAGVAYIGQRPGSLVSARAALDSFASRYRDASEGLDAAEQPGRDDGSR